jgi:hypothetical protein
MSTFSDDPASFGTHAAYVNLLRTAVNQVDLLLKNKDIDEKVAEEARKLLRPRKEKPKTA